MTESFPQSSRQNLHCNTVYRDIASHEYYVTGTEEDLHRVLTNKSIVEIIVPHQENDSNRFFTLHSILLLSQKIEITLDTSFFLNFNPKKILCEFDNVTNSYQILQPEINNNIIEFFVIGNIHLRE